MRALDGVTFDVQKGEFLAVVGCQLPLAGEVRFKVYEILGREVAVLVNGRKGAGVHEVRFGASGLASGFYMYRLEAGGSVQTRRMLFTK